MMFEDLQQLFESFNNYKDGQTYKFRQANLYLEDWAEHKAFKLENELLNNDFQSTQQELSQIQHPNFYQKYLLQSINHTMAKKDIDAVFDCHRYFDYNLNFRDRTQPKQPHLVKVHQPALNLAGLHLRLGQLDQSLLGVLETIRISQNKNDHEAIL